jgi:glycosyltransferase involved in cell wall biosynthesis
VSPVKPSLSYYSYDSQRNPWCAGGGALRDLEALKRYASRWQVTLYVGRFPGFLPVDMDGIRIRALGWGGSNLVCRITFGLMANLRILFDRADRIGNSLSAFAPILTGALRRGRFFAVLQHIVAGDSLKKFGAAGLVPYALETLMLRLGRNFIVSNGGVAARILAVNPKARVLTTSNSIDGALLKLAPTEAQPPFILFLGRFDIHMKGLDLLLEAFRDVTGAATATAASAASAATAAVSAAGRSAAPDLSRTRLVLAGAASPAALEAVRRLVPAACADRVELRPNVSDSDKRSLLASCQFFCSPSRFEGFGIAALEANAAAKPVLVTDTDGFRASVKRDVSALVVPVGDAAALRSGMAALLADGELRRRLGEGGREWAKGFDWDAIAEKEAAWIANGFTPRPPVL